MSINSKPADDLQVISAPTIKLELSLGALEISPIKVKQLPAFTQAVAPLLNDIVAGTDMLLLVTHHADDVIKAIAVGALISREVVDALEVDELIKLGSAVLEVNADFFMQRVLPQINQSAENLSLKLAGQTLLPDSLKAASV